MKKITDILTQKVSAAFEDAGYTADLGAVTVSNRPELCQFQCNGALGGAKKFRKPPMAIAGEIASALASDAAFKEVSAAPPGFINITLSDDYIVSLLGEISGDPALGVSQDGAGQTIVIDYGGPNVAKELHIGHLRSAIIGEALKRTARAVGCTVYGDVHFGDWGTPYGLTIAEYKVRHPDWACFRDDFDPARDSFPDIDEKELNQIYPYASAKAKEDPDFKAEARQVVVDLQNRKPGIFAIWKKMKDVSVASTKRIYAGLSVDFDYWYGESDADVYTPELIEILKNKGLLYESEGAQVVDVSEESDKISVPPIIVKKSDNSSIYATWDLAAIIQRERDFKPDKIWYLTDKRQNLHFTQVFRCAKKAGLVPETTELRHLGFGAMTGPDGKPFKTRDGGVLSLGSLMEMVDGAALEKLKDSEYIVGDKREVAHKIGVAGLKFGDMQNHPTKDYIFDLDKFLSFDGKTGTYLLYTVTRINSILKKAGEQGGGPITGIFSDAERELALGLLMTPEAYSRAFCDMNPSALCDAAYTVAQSFSKLYHDTKILSEEDSAKRSSLLSLCSLTGRCLEKMLACLGIETVENM